MRDNEQKVTEKIEQQQVSASSDAVQEIEKIQQKRMKSFASILQTSLSQFTRSLGQLLINQTSKRLAGEYQEVTGK